MQMRARNLLGRLRRVDPVWWDALIACVCLVAGLVQVWAARSGYDARIAQTCIEVVLAAAVALRRRALFPMLLVILVTGFVVFAIDGSHATHGPAGTGGSLLTLLVFYGAGAYLDGWRSLVGLIAGLGVIAQSTVGADGQVVANLLWNMLVVGLLPWFVGRTMRERAAQMRAHRERAERLDAEREMHMRVAALAERARLAREIHDVVAHSVSVMVIQAAGARTVMDAEPERADEALNSVERAGREALAEMRRLLGVLDDGRRLRELAPQPGLDDLDELLERTEAAGLHASISVVGQPVAVSPGLSLCAYRLVQEALTNAIKHGRAARAEVAISWAPDALVLEVADNGRVGDSHGGDHGSGRSLSSGGHGIVGMRERVALHGGVVEAGPAPTGGFAVRVMLPLVSEVMA